MESAAVCGALYNIVIYDYISLNVLILKLEGMCLLMKIVRYVNDEEIKDDALQNIEIENPAAIQLMNNIVLRLTNQNEDCQECE